MLARDILTFAGVLVLGIDSMLPMHQSGVVQGLLVVTNVSVFMGVVDLRRFIMGNMPQSTARASGTEKGNSSSSCRTKLLQQLL